MLSASLIVFKLFDETPILFDETWDFCIVVRKNVIKSTPKMKLLTYLFSIVVLLSSCQALVEEANTPQEGEADTSVIADSLTENPAKNLVLVELKVREGEEEKVFELLNSEMGLPHTRAYDGCLSLEMVYNEEAKTVLIFSNWESYDKYGGYFKWRREVDTTMAALMPLLEEENPMVVYTPNSHYRLY